MKEPGKANAWHRTLKMLSVSRWKLPYCLTACAASLLVFTCLAHAQSPDGLIASSLVYIVATGETQDGNPVSTQGTGIVVSSDGYILTSYHLISKLDKSPTGSPNDKLRPETVEIKASFGKKDPPDKTAAVVSSVPEIDLLLLKIPQEAKAFAHAPIATYEELAATTTGTAVYTSGFSEQGDVSYQDQLTSKNGPGGISWTLLKPPSNGQSGSPIYNAKGTVLGIMKGSSSNSGVFIPIELADGLLAPIKFRDFESGLLELSSQTIVFQCYLVGSMERLRTLLQINVAVKQITDTTEYIKRFQGRDPTKLTAPERYDRDNAQRGLQLAQDSYEKLEGEAQKQANFDGRTCNAQSP